MLACISYSLVPDDPSSLLDVVEWLPPLLTTHLAGEKPRHSESTHGGVGVCLFLPAALTAVVCAPATSQALESIQDCRQLLKMQVPQAT